MNDSICDVEWNQIRVSPFQPRRHFSEEELEELASSIRAVGLIHPPIVRLVESGGKVLYYELIAGERRWRASKLAGFSKVKVIVREIDDEQAAKSTLIENIQRVDLDPIEMAEAFKSLIAVFRMTQEEMAEKLGKKRSTIANYLRLLSLPTSIQQSLSKKAITMGHAKAILSLESPQLQEKLTDLIVQKQLNVREAEKESKKFVRMGKKKGSSSSKDQHIAEIEEALQQLLGTKVRIEPSRKGGKVTIHYYTDDDLERLVSVINA